MKNRHAFYWFQSKTAHTYFPPRSLLHRVPRVPVLCFHKKYSKSTVKYSSFSLSLVILVTLGFAFGGSFYVYQTSKGSKNYHYSVLSKRSLSPGVSKGMVSTVLPGRPGNLTKEQEAKLQQLWTLVLQVFGIDLTIDQNANGTDKDDDQGSQTDVAAPDKKKKRRMHMFGRKHQGELVMMPVNNVTDSEDKYGQNKEFQKTLATQSPEDIRRSFWDMVKHDHPDGLLLRFLRARKWDVHNALVMLIATMHWRLKEMHVDEDIMRNGEATAALDSLSSNQSLKKEGADFMAQLRLGKSFLHGTDKEGRPICFVRVRLHKQGEQSEASLERYTVYTIETARLLLASNVDTAAILFDMTGFSMANMDYTPVKFMIKCFEANYPESLGVVLVHKSPWIFQGIWNIIKGWLDPVVASKVHFTKTIDELEEYIEKSHILKELGGDDPFTYQYIEPISGENKAMTENDTKQRLLDARAAIVKEFESTTVEWIKAVGGSDFLQQKRNELSDRLRSGYWQIDPYLRARSIYDRLGMIREGGKIHFYDPPKPDTPNAVPPISTQNGPLPAGSRDDDLD